MVPPIYLGNQVPIVRVGDQNTYVFFKDGVETFVIRPGYQGKVDEFGMLIPMPSVPALRKVSDNVFSHVRAAVDPPEVVIDLRRRFLPNAAAAPGNAVQQQGALGGLRMSKKSVRVLKEEAVGMYEVAVLEAGSSAALKKWMDEHGYKYPKGMDKACDDYVKIGWCFVAVKTKIGQKKGADPKPGMRRVNTKLPAGSTFDGHVQAMGFRFKTDKLVVPMRLSTFNEGDLHNIVYVLSDEPQKIRSVPEEYVVRQIPGTELFRNVTGPLPLRIIGGKAKDIPAWQKKNLKQRRNPVPHNGAARDLFAADMLAIKEKRLSHPHEEKEKMFLRIGEKLGLRGPEIDKLNEGALIDDREKAVTAALKGVESMTLTVIDGNFPREVLANQNLTFAGYKMPARRNSSRFYDAKTKKPTNPPKGFRTLGVVSQADVVEPLKPVKNRNAGLLGMLLPFAFVLVGGVFLSRRRRGLPAPIICDFLSREESRSHYDAGTEFHIGRIEMVANTGTYVDSPFHRYADGKDLSELPLESLANLSGVVVDSDGRTSIDADALRDIDVAGKAVLIRTGWSQHWKTERYFEDHPFLTAAAAAYLRDEKAALWFAFVRDNNVFIHPTAGGDDIQLSKDGAEKNAYGLLNWSPDSRSLVAFRIEPGERKEVHLIESSPKGAGRARLRSRPYPLPGDRFSAYEVNLFQIDGRRQTKPKLERIDFGRPRVYWKADGRRFWYRKVDRGHQRLRVVEVDAHTGASKTLIDETSKTFVWTAHGGRPFLRYLRKTDEFIFGSERDGWHHLYLIDGKTGKVKHQITKGKYVVRGIEQIDEANRQIWFRASGKNPDQDPYFLHDYRVDFDGSNLVALTAGNGNHRVRYSPDRRFLIDTYSRVDMPPVHELRRTTDGKRVVRLETADITELEARGWKAPEVFVAKGRDGKTDIWGIICRPREIDPKKKYPVVEYIYAGPHDSYVPKSFSAFNRFSSLTDLGFIVVQMDGMGTANRSKAFHDVCWHNLKDAGFPDRILWHKAAAKKYPYIDISRVGIYGTSAGGQSAMGALLFHGNFYKAAVAACGCHDNRMDKASWNEQWMGYPVGPHYAACSNVDNAWRLRGKLLLIVGELDTNVPPESTMRVVDALIKANKDFDLLVMPGVGGLDLSRRQTLFKGGDSGPAVVPGKPQSSRLVERISEGSMPPEKRKRLSKAEIAALTLWIKQGAKWPKGRRLSLFEQTTDKRAGLDWWSLQPIRRPALPRVQNSAWVRNPIDAFVLAKLEAKEISPSPVADRRTLLRRMSLVLTGLPPSHSEIQRFANDTRPGAVERAAARLLNSPHYGERWARHWLDIARFAETNGFETNTPRPNAWRFRDYVIDAFNSDKPYNEFVKEQIAGDVFSADVATGFLVAGAYDTVKSPDINLTLMQRQDELHDMVNATSTAFLGLTVACARCHNHKFDPILQKDYYAFQAVFAGVKHGDRPLHAHPDPKQKTRIAATRRRLEQLRNELADSGLREPVNARSNIERFSPVPAKFVRFTVLATNASEPCIDELEVFSAGQSPRNVALASSKAKVTSSGSYSGNPKHKLEHVNDGRYGNSRSWISNQNGKGWVRIELPRVTLIDRIQWGRDRQGRYKDRLATRYRIEVATQTGVWRTVATSDSRLPFGSSGKAIPASSVPGFSREKLAKVNALLRHIRKLEQELNAMSRPAVAYAGQFVQPGPTHRLHRGDPLAKREIVAPAAITALGRPLGLKTGSPENRRRQALAAWIADARNPLAARVMVNRIWQHHFGRGIVATPSDFGRMGVPPTHPELLDWLAAEFIHSGFSVKHIQRLIVGSNTWRQSSRPRTAAMKVDAGSKLLWRFPPRRLEAEAVRDSILLAAGTLRDRMRGPGFSVFKPNTNYVRVYEPKEQWGPPEWRRMIYATKVRMEHDAVFGALDCPDAGQATAKRPRSTTPLQALNLLNSGFMLQQAELMSADIKRRAGANVPQQRLASAKKINELIAEHGTRPAILAGDLNATPQSDVLKTFAKQWTVANRKERPTIPVTKPRKQIDFILHRPASRWKAVEVRVLDEAVASDHRAIFAILERKPTANRQSKRNNTASPNGVSSVPNRAIHVAKRVTPNDTFVSAANETAAESEPVKNRPNILLITADNLGYGDLRMYNRASTIKTPNLDRFARQGARLTRFYTASPTCTVSRACLLTGRIAPRHGLENQLPGVKGNYGVGLNHKEILIPQVLRMAPTRYATGCFGKWNIGFAKGSRPTERGFDEFIGHASGNCDYYQHNYREKHDLYDGIKELHREGEYTTDIFADAAIDFMNRNTKAGRPWFCYLPFNAPHFPVAGNKKPGKPNNWQAPDWAFKAYGLSPDETDPTKRYAAVVTALDKAIGRVLTSLDASGAGKNTFVFFMSDNGAFKLRRKGLDVGSNHPLRHGGVTCWEGGLRVAALARWPGKIKPGSVISEPFWSPDLMIACAKLAGAKLPVGVRLDGKDPLPLLTQNAKSPHQSFYFTFRRHAALRMGNLKIVRERPDRPWQLFDLSQDESESTDLAKQRPGDAYRITRISPTRMYDGKRCWCHPRAGIVPAAGKNGLPRVVMTMNTLSVSGSDVFKAMHGLRTDNLGKSWSGPRELSNLAIRHETIKGEKRPVAVSDFTPGWHAATKTLLGTGHTVVYTPKWKIAKVRPRHTSFATYDAATDRWSPWQKLEMPEGPKFRDSGAGCTQRFDLADGTILLPIYFRPPGKNSRVTIAHCTFDGKTLRFKQQGNELSIDDKTRGLHEPSLTRFNGEYFLTIRNDKRGFVTRSKDGLNFRPIETWKFDDGKDLGNYNTQQHWVTHSDALYLVYTRKGAKNDHVFRHRAPLFIAQANYEIEIRYVQFPLHPETPATGLTLEELFAGRDIDIPAAKRRMEQLMAEEGLPYGDRQMTYNSRLAQELAKWAESIPGGDDIHDRLFRAYFVSDVNLADVHRLVEIAEETGLPGDEARRVLETRSFQSAVDEDWLRSRQLGVTSVPTFVAGDRGLVGAQPYEALEQLVQQAGAAKRKS
eukprot:g8402.t1